MKLGRDYSWFPIHFLGNHYYDTHECKHYYAGEEYGIQWFIDPDTERAEWLVTATDGKREYEERLEWVHEPVFGIDVTDAERTEEAICRLVSKCKSNKFVRFKDWFMNKFKRK